MGFFDETLKGLPNSFTSIEKILKNLFEHKKYQKIGFYLPKIGFTVFLSIN